MLCDVIEHGNIDLCTAANALDLLRGLDELVRRDDMAFCLECRQLFIKIRVAFLIFLTAAAPASVISSKF